MNENVRIEYRFSHLLDVDYASHPNMLTYSGRILIKSGDEFDNYDSAEIEVGMICLEMYDLNFEAGFCTLREAFDKSESSLAVGKAILNDSFEKIDDKIVDLVGDSFNTNVLLVSRLEIKEKYRGQGYGKYVLNSLDIYFKSTCAYVAINSFPLGFEGITDDVNYDKAQKRLNSFYSKCGYKKIRDEADNDIEEEDFDELDDLNMEFLDTEQGDVNHIFIKNIAPV
ncbi:hypothetical protein [Ancylomarina sp. 16SWW S1-10-2]|uniref:hypothetical protein n=1 Tax=Ancylomarina sp. 16SWW S1-10-2 TaxID=2499681 RepID=UPI0012AE5543|nr:hypothetical protein [Ancylomarina sp. 16SWW S1-10-2]MRT92666.1 hypothetical protein [Ancylomarina sp. 16SWW S1-10-2]